MSIDYEKVKPAKVSVFYDNVDEVASIVGRKEKGYVRTVLYLPDKNTISVCGLANGKDGKFRKAIFSPFGTHVSTLDYSDYGDKYSVLKYDAIPFEDIFFMEFGDYQVNNLIVFDLETGEGYVAGLKGVSSHIRLFELVISGEEVRIPFFEYDKKYVFLRVN